MYINTMDGDSHMQDPEMDFLNAMFRAELEKFKSADETVKRKVVEAIAAANALDWLIEICERDDDPDMQSYARIARDMQ